MKIKLSKSRWEEMGKKAGWVPLDKNKILDDAFDFLNSAEKQLSVAGETDLAIELQKFSMKVLDRKQRKTTGKKIGQIKQSQQEDFNEIKQIIDEGQRACHLRKSINACPNFDNPIHRKAWKAGYHSALHRKTLNEAFNDFTKQQSSEDFASFMDSLDEDNPAKLKPAIRMIIKEKEPSSFGILLPEREFDKRKLDQILGKHEFNAQPQTIKELAKKLWYGISDWKSDETSGYSLIVDGKAVNFSS
jgi:hypothetical protein